VCLSHGFSAFGDRTSCPSFLRSLQCEISSRRSRHLSSRCMFTPRSPPGPGELALYRGVLCRPCNGLWGLEGPIPSLPLAEFGMNDCPEDVRGWWWGFPRTAESRYVTACLTCVPRALGFPVWPMGLVFNFCLFALLLPPPPFLYPILG